MNCRHTFLLVLFCCRLSLVHAQQTGVVIRCAPSITAASSPLFLVDGVVISQDQLKELDPLDISSIYILKDAESSVLFGCMAAHGCVMITTKSAGRRIIQVYDLVTNKPVDTARLQIIEEQNSFPLSIKLNGSYYHADSVHPGTNYRVTVTAVGYQAFTGFNNFQQKDTLRIGLAPNIPEQMNDREKTGNFRVQFSLFPNPVTRDGIVNINLATNRPVVCRVLNMQGSVIKQQAIINSGTMRMAGLAGGIYFVQAVSTTGVTLTTKKLCVQ